MAEGSGSPARMAERLRKWVDERAPHLDESAARWLREGDGPVLRAEASSEADVADMLRIASAEGWKVAPLGSASRIDRGNPAAAVDLAISARPMDRIVEYSPADMIVTVQAGMPLCELQSALRAKGQFLPVDPLCADGSTIGGLVATGGVGPLRALYGTFRDLAVAARAVSAAGDVIRTGARVVKNVAGYDMTKLFIGAHGTLAFVSELTFKVRPLPLCEAVGVATGSRAQVDALRARVMDSALAPATLEALSGFREWPGSGAGAADRVALAIGAHDVREAARVQGERLRQWADALAMTFAQLEGDEAGAFWEAYRRRFRGAPGVFRISFPPAQMMERAEALQGYAARGGVSAAYSLTLNAGSGRLFIDDGEGVTPAWAGGLRDMVERAGGRLEVERAPLAVKRCLDSFSPPGKQIAYMKALKRQLDPKAILNPGRLMGGI